MEQFKIYKMYKVSKKQWIVFILDTDEIEGEGKLPVDTNWYQNFLKESIPQSV